MLLVFLLVTSGFSCTFCTGCARFVVSSKEEKPLMLVEKDAPVLLWTVAPVLCVRTSA